MANLMNRLERLEKRGRVFTARRHFQVIAKANRMRLNELNPGPELEKRLAALHAEVALRVRNGSFDGEEIAELWKGDEALQRAYLAGHVEKLASSPEIGIWTGKKFAERVLKHAEWARGYLKDRNEDGSRRSKLELQFAEFFALIDSGKTLNEL